ncbi:unnamed protein product [Effrenium voratum]|nr:unnamed protein product [Effrenium voratum]
MDMAPAKSSKSQPQLAKHTEELLKVLKKLPAAELKRMMGLSPELTKQTAARFANFKKQPSKAACLAFDGPAFRGLGAKDFSKAEEKLAQSSIRILCALYGVLRPYDCIRPYRLEMASKLKTARGKSMYDFWGEVITDAIIKDLKASKAKVLVNLASQEFFKCIKPSKIKGAGVKLVTVDFSGPSALVKQARGSMCRFMVKKRIKDPAGLKKFTGDGKSRFVFSAAKSSEQKLVFTQGAECHVSGFPWSMKMSSDTGTHDDYVSFNSLWPLKFVRFRGNRKVTICGFDSVLEWIPAKILEEEENMRMMHHGGGITQSVPGGQFRLLVWSADIEPLDAKIPWKLLDSTRRKLFANQEPGPTVQWRRSSASGEGDETGASAVPVLVQELVRLRMQLDEERSISQGLVAERANLRSQVCKAQNELEAFRENHKHVLLGMEQLAIQLGKAKEREVQAARMEASLQTVQAMSESGAYPGRQDAALAALRAGLSSALEKPSGTEARASLFEAKG